MSARRQLARLASLATVALVAATVLPSSVVLARPPAAGLPPGRHAAPRSVRVHRLTEAGPGDLPARFRESVQLAGLDLPSAFAFAPDGRVFVAEKAGLVKVFDSTADTTPTIFVDLRAEVHDSHDRGLLGIALDPHFRSHPWVYLSYTRDAPPGTQAPFWGSGSSPGDPCPAAGCLATGRIVRIRADGDVAVGAPQVLLSRGWCYSAPMHSMDTLRFGPDGMLYASSGEGADSTTTDYGQIAVPADGCGDPPGRVGAAPLPPATQGGSLRAQDLLFGHDPVGLDGAVIRIDPRSGAPAADHRSRRRGQRDANARRIVAYGLRNPFHFTFRPGTPELWVGDVGWGSREEIDVVGTPAAGPPIDFGWPCYEGAGVQPGWAALHVQACRWLYQHPGRAHPPLFSYGHDAAVSAADSCAQGGGVISGLAFARGDAYPSQYRGALFFADYARDCIWVMPAGADGRPDPGAVRSFDTRAASVVDLQTGPGGDLYYLDIADGTLRRIHYYPDDQPPIARISADPTSGAAPLTVHLDASGSSDADGEEDDEELQLAWDLDGDGTFTDAVGPTAEHTFSAVGRHLVRLRATDEEGLSDIAVIEVDVGVSPPRPVIDAPVRGQHWQSGQVIDISGGAVDAQGAPLPAADLHWQVLLYHCPSTCHVHYLQSFDGTATASFEAPDHDYPSYLQLVLTATDGSGLSATRSLTLRPRTAALHVVSRPAGASVALDAVSSASRAGVSQRVIRASSHTVSAAAHVRVGGVTWDFVSWSDGGARTHQVRGPRLDTTLVAHYERHAGLQAPLGSDAPTPP